MKVEPMAINRYKICKWMTKYGGIFYGIDVIIYGKSYHVKNDESLFFDEKKDAIRCVKKMNKDLRAERSPN